MEQQQLSSKAQAAFISLNELQPEERKQVLALANQINDAASPAKPEQRAEASSKLVEGVQAACAHGFKQLTAPDGKAAIEVRITRSHGGKVTCLLSEGVRGKWYRELADYGRNELQGVTLLSQDDFKAVVESLYSAIRGQKVVKGVLQTDDAALKQAYQIVTEGLRRDGRWFSWARFDLDKEGAVAGRPVYGNGYAWRVRDYRNFCALFGALPAELK